MSGRAAKVVISERQQEALRRIVRRRSSPQFLVQRAKVILLAFERYSCEQIEGETGLERHAIGRWRKLWKQSFERLIAVECGEGPEALKAAIITLLSDKPRSGRKPKFKGEQVAQILAIACEKPDEESARPVTHWTPTELAQEARKRGAVDSISARQVGRFLKNGRD
jgi:putative transposase